MKSKYIKFLAVALIIFAVTSAFGQETFSFKSWEGKWKGTLEYLDYLSNERVKLKAFVVIKPSPDGTSAEIFTTYDDFGKVLKNGETERIDLAAKKFFIGEEEFSIDSIEKGKIVLLGSGEDGNTVEPFRKTITFTDDSLTILKETRTPWSFRNQLTLTKVKENSTALRNFSVKELKEDFAVMKAALKKLHSGIYRYNTPEELEKKFDAFEAKLNKPLPEGEFFKLVSQMLSEIKCYHTNPNPFNQKKEITEGLFNQTNYFPFYFEIIDRKMIITENASSKNLPRGSEITKINGVPVKEIIENLLTTTFADGLGTIEHRLKTLEVDRFSGSTYSIFDMMFPLFYPPNDGTFKVEAVDFKTKKTTNFEILAMTKAERTEEMEKRYGKTPTYDDGWKFEIWADNTAYIRIENFITWRLSFKIKDFFAASFAEMREKNVKNLVIDIRNSDGGDTNVYFELFKYMFNKEFPCNFGTKSFIRNVNAAPEFLKYIETYDKELEFVIKNGVPENFYKKAENGYFELVDNEKCTPVQPYENRFRGKIYMLVNSANASAAYTFPRYAKEYKLATLIGQETGGNLKGFNGGGYLFFYLPNSKFEFDIPVKAIFSDGENEDSGVKPDIFVKRKPEDIGNKFDRELERVKEIIKLNQR